MKHDIGLFQNNEYRFTRRGAMPMTANELAKIFHIEGKKVDGCSFDPLFVLYPEKQYS